MTLGDTIISPGKHANGGGCGREGRERAFGEECNPHQRRGRRRRRRRGWVRTEVDFQSNMYTHTRGAGASEGRKTHR